MSEFLRRMDTDRNGRLDPSEIDERAKRFIEPMLRAAGIDPNRPVSIRRLEELRRSRDDRRSGDRDSDRRDRGSSNSRDSNDNEVALVPGFGNEYLDTAVLGFGLDESVETEWRSDYTKQHLDRARDTIRRYDLDKNGVLERSEWNGVSWRYGDPNGSDLNKDGRLTLKEFAERYAKRERDDAERRKDYEKQSADRRKENEQRRAAGGGSSGGDWRSRFFGSGGSSDRGGSSRDSSSTGSSSDDKEKTSSGTSKFDRRKSVRLATAMERLPRGLPDWFAQKDANGDGQVAMSEYASRWTESDVAAYVELDRNNDGLITPQEALDGPTSRSARSYEPRETQGSNATRSDTTRSDTTPADSASGSPSAEEKPAAPAESSSSGDKYQAYAKSYLDRRDANKNGVLEGDEWNDVRDAEKIDKNRNGKIDMRELLEHFKR